MARGAAAWREQLVLAGVCTPDGLAGMGAGILSEVALELVPWRVCVYDKHLAITARPH